jgi:hypothetical protein
MLYTVDAGEGQHNRALYTGDAGECRCNRALLGTTPHRLEGLALVLVLVLVFQPDLDFHFTKVLASYCRLHIWGMMLHPLLIGILIFSFAMLMPPRISCCIFSALRGATGEERR